LFDSRVYSAALYGFLSAEADDLPGVNRLRIKLLPEARNGFSGELIDFESATDAFEVVGMDFPGGFGVDFFKLLIKFFRALVFFSLAELATNCLVFAGSFEEAVDKDLEVKGGAADGDDGFVF